jgi:16S rRNA (cytosine967-C5)-methyltransferase
LKRKSPRAICFEILNRIEKTDSHLDRLLTDSFKRYRHLTLLDRAFLTELTYGSLRWREKLDWAIRHLSKVPFEKIEPEIINLLRLGIYQLLFLSRTPASAAVNESVEIAKTFRGTGGAGFVNGILRSLIRQKEEIPYPGRDENLAVHLSVAQSYPLWLTRRWVEEMGPEDAWKVAEFNNRRSVLTLRVNRLKMDRETLIEKLRGKGLKPIPTPYSAEGIRVEDPPPTSELPFVKEGFYILQDEASQLVTLLLDPKPGERILDACAAPGGKTTHIAQRMGDKGEIDALDLTREKLNRIEEACQRLEIKIIKTMKGDASRPLPLFREMEFDRILADVPCSGFGTLRKNPDLKWRREEKDIQRLSELQFSILKNLSDYLREGGILVYSTCTLFHEENEDIIDRFLKSHPEFRLDQIGNVLPESCHPFIRNGYFKTFPPENEMDGFFAARMIKKR